MHRLRKIVFRAGLLLLLLALVPACRSASPADGESGSAAEKSGESTDPNRNTSAQRNTEPSILTRTGCIEGNCINGEGVFRYSTGDVYRGQFADGKREGRGIFEYANGDKYEGNFQNGQRKGFGAYTFSNGDKYVGEFSNGKLKGIGTYRFADGTSLKGTFEDNGTSGEGILVDERDKDKREEGRDCTVENRLLFCRN